VFFNILFGQKKEAYFNKDSTTSFQKAENNLKKKKAEIGFLFLT